MTAGWYWPCTDPPGSTLASNLAPGNTTPLYVTESKYGSSGETAAFGQNASALPGAQQTLVISPTFRLSNESGMWGTTLASTLPGGGVSLVATDSNFPPVKNGVTIELWFQSLSASGTPFPATGAEVLTLLAPGGPLLGVGAILQVFISAVDGSLQMSWPGPHGGLAGNATLSSANHENMAAPAQLALTMTASAWTAYLNGAEAASGAFSPAMRSFSTIAVNGYPGFHGQGPGPFSGFVGHVAVFPSVLPANRIRTHYQAGITALAGEPSQDRIERLLQAGGVTGRRCIIKSSGAYVTPVVSCQDIPGQPVSSSISNIAQDLLPGMFFIAPTGDVVSFTRQHVWGQEPAWTLGEQKYAGEYQYDGDITFDYDPTRVQDQIQLTQLDNQDIIVPSVTGIETAAQKQIGTIGNLSTGYLQGDATVPMNFGPGLYDLANWLATTYQAPQLRLTQVTVDASKDPSRWPFVLGASVGDVTQVNRRPPSSGNTSISVTGRITQTQRSLRFSIAGVAAKVTCVIDPAPEVEALQLDSVTDGLLDGKHPLAW